MHVRHEPVVHQRPGAIHAPVVLHERHSPAPVVAHRLPAIPHSPVDLRWHRPGAAVAQPVFWVNGRRYVEFDAAQAAAAGGVGGGLHRESSMRGLSVEDLFSPEYEDRVKTRIRELFHKYAGSDRRLQLYEMEGLASSLALELGISKDVFGELSFLFWRYDFSGDGNLDEQEGVLLIEGMLHAWRDASETTAGSRSNRAVSRVIPQKNLTDHYILGRELGRGGQGAVYLAEDKARKQKVVKFYDKADQNMSMADIVAEVKLLNGLDHAKIARVYEYFQDRAYIYVVSEPYFGGDLNTVVEKAQNAGIMITYDWFAAIWRQALDGVEYLHSKHVMHCDLKEANVMISGKETWSAPNVVVIDFGLAKSFSGGGGRLCGTPGYMPAEVWEIGLWTPKGDTFSMGVMFYKMIVGKLPFDHPCRETALRGLLPQTPPCLELEGCGTALNAMLQRMLSRDFHSRPIVAVVKNDTFFEQVLTRQEIDRDAVRQLAAVTKKNPLHTALLADMARQQNLAQLEEISHIFTTMDADNDGVVDASEARTALARVLPSDQVEEMIDALMGDDGNVSYTAFMGQMLAQKHASMKQTLWKLFREADTDGSGYLDIRELQALLERPVVAEMMPGKTAAELMREMDDNLSGRVSWEEFRNTLDPPQRRNYRVGQNVDYYSSTHNQWIPCMVERVDEKSGSIMINIKNNFWIQSWEQTKKIRPSTGGDASSAKAAAVGRQVLAGALRQR